jgi:hypothetical protein
MTPCAIATPAQTLNKSKLKNRTNNNERMVMPQTNATNKDSYCLAIW